MIEKIVKREDLGKLLGEGVKKAALGVGKILLNLPFSQKGLSPSYHDPRCFLVKPLIILSITGDYATMEVNLTHVK